MTDSVELLSYVRMMFGLPDEKWIVRAQGDDESAAIVIQIEGDFSDPEELRRIADQVQALLSREVAP